jgi:hypothetical protein
MAFSRFWHESNQRLTHFKIAENRILAQPRSEIHQLPRRSSDGFRKGSTHPTNLREATAHEFIHHADTPVPRRGLGPSPGLDTPQLVG